MLDCLAVNRGRDYSESEECRCSVAFLTCYSFAGLDGCSSGPSGGVVEEEIPRILERGLEVEQRFPLACSDMG